MTRKCQCGCHLPATGGNGITAWASLDCAVKIAEKRRAKTLEQRAREQRKKNREEKIAAKPIEYFLRKAEKAVNAYIRERDAEEACISCGTWDALGWHAGHFIPVGRARAIRFDYANINRQCDECNTHKNGNATEYEKRLIQKIGKEEVERLKVAPKTKKWTREEVQAIEADARAKLKALIAGRGMA